MSITIKGVTSGGVDLKAPDTGTNTTITLPSATGTLLPTDGDGSGLTNLTSANLVGALPALDGSSLTGVAPTKATIDALGISASSITGALPAIDGSNLTGVSGGKVLQVVSALWHTDVYPSPSNTTMVDVGSALSITPSSTASKILCLYTFALSMSTGNYSCMNGMLQRDGSDIESHPYMGYVNNEAFHRLISESFSYLDSPSSTSALAYKLQAGNGTGSSFSGTYNGGINISGKASSLTLMEIAG
jgi:hypothetical protein